MSANANPNINQQHGMASILMGESFQRRLPAINPMAKPIENSSMTVLGELEMNTIRDDSSDSGSSGPVSVQIDSSAIIARQPKQNLPNNL